jgi:hypothetical protein
MCELRLLRGRVRIRPDDPPKMIGLIHVPDTVKHNDERDRKIARTGVVMQLGATMQTKRGHDVPHGFEPGDRVVYVFGQLSSDGQDAWCAQHEVIGVIE